MKTEFDKGLIEKDSTKHKYLYDLLALKMKIIQKFKKLIMF